MAKPNLPVHPDPILTQWRQALTRTLRRTQTPTVPWNFRITPKRGGLLLEWERVTTIGADGYELVRSDDADFSEATITITVENNLQTAYFDAIALSGAALPTRYYKIRATAGTKDNPRSVKGVLSGIVSAAPLDPSDAATTPTTTYDPVTDDDWQGQSREGPILE